MDRRKADTTAGSIAKAARSTVMSAGEPEMEPSREMRRPFWSVRTRQRVTSAGRQDRH